MKQTRRKELKTNELQLWLQQTYQSLERNSTYILAGVLAVVAILVIALLIQQRRHNKQQTAWNMYYELREKDVTAEPDALDRVRQLAAGWGDDANLGPFVLPLKGSMENRLALSLTRPEDKDRKIQLLKDASATYIGLLARFKDLSTVAAEARMSLAGIEESLVVLGAGSVDKVRQYYQELVETKPNAYADLAAERLGALDQRLRPIEIIATRPAATLPATPVETAPAAVAPPATTPAATAPATLPATAPGG